MIIMKCPVCDSDSTRLFLERHGVPVHQNVLLEKQEHALTIARGDLRITICHDCGFVFNGAFSPKIMSYDQKYENTQNYSPLFEEYVNGTVDYLIKQRGVVNSKIVEVGCGKGTFLRKLVERGNNEGIGFDPSYIGPLEDLSGRLVFKREFYDDRYLDLIADFVICRHVIEHIEDPVSMLRSIRQAVQNSENVLVFFETPNVDWILENKVVWDFFYEHCSYFSSQSILVAFEKAGFFVEAVSKIFGGQYLWVEARPAGMSTPSSKPIVERSISSAEDFGKVNMQLNELWQKMIVGLRKLGGVAVWGAGAKGVTFANLFDPNREMISCIVDVNPNKQGNFLPGTGHPIISPEELSVADGIATIIIMNPIYRREVEKILTDLKARPFKLIEFSKRSKYENIS